MQYFIKGMDTSSEDDDALIKPFALIRSAFEDIRQVRRRAQLRGINQSEGILYRSDDTRPRLLTDSEEAKANKQRQLKQAAAAARARQANSQRGRHNSKGGGSNSQRQRSSSQRGRGAGKGKGRGRAQSRGPQEEQG